MFKKIAVGDIMTRNLITVKPEASLYKCAKELVKNRVNTILVSENKRLKGILTARDILWAIIKKPNLDLKNIRIIDIAAKKVAVIKPAADVNQAFQKMKKFGFRRLPVLSKGKVVGMLSLKDILRVYPSLYGEVGNLFSIREEEQKIRKLSETENWDSEGVCDECNEFAPLLGIEGRQLCPNCRDALY